MMKGRVAVVEAEAEAEAKVELAGVKVNMRGWDMGRVMKRSEGGMVFVFNLTQGAPRGLMNRAAFWDLAVCQTR